MIDLQAVVEDFGRRTGADRGLTFISLDRSSPEGRAAALVLFAGGRAEPLAVVKAATDEVRALRLRIEHANLCRLRSEGGPVLRQSVPAPLYLGRVGETSVLAQAAVPGTLMQDLPPRRYFASARFRKHFVGVVRWLDELGGTIPAERLGGETAARLAARQVARYREHHAVSPALEQLLEEATARVAASSVPLAPWHGDLCTANVLFHKAEIRVIDWEHPLGGGWPLADLLHFAASVWCVPYSKGREAREANYRSMFFERHALSGLLHESVAWYAERRGLAPRDVVPLAALSWVAHANRKREQTPGEPGTVEHLPLVMLAGGGCVNLETLAESRERFLCGP